MSLLFFILLDGMQTLPGVSGVGLAIERSQLSLSCSRMHLSSGYSWRTQLYMKAYSIILSAPAASSCTEWRTARETSTFSSCMALMFTGTHFTKHTLTNGRSRQEYLFIYFLGGGVVTDA